MATASDDNYTMQRGGVLQEGVFKKALIASAIAASMISAKSPASLNTYTSSYTQLFPLEIVQPQSGLGTTNRYYKAYPGLLYEVRVGAHGGVYPYNYSLTSAPSGMSINASTGLITWSNPTTAGSPYSISAKVVDSLGNQASVNWTITVTTTGFLFVDAVNGTTIAGGGTGTFANPWKTLADVYGGPSADKYTVNHPGEFVYWRAGSYYIDVNSTSIESPGVEDRLAWSGYKPIVHLAYPGESVVLYNKSAYNDAHIQFYNPSAAPIDNLYIDGWEINDNLQSRGKALVVSQDAGGAVLRNLYIHNMNSTPYSDNHSQIFFTGSAGQNNYIETCTFRNGVSNYAILDYNSDHFLMEDLDADGSVAGVSPKDGNAYTTIRNSKIINCVADGVNCQTYDASGRGHTQYIECYNVLITMTTAGNNYSDRAVDVNDNNNTSVGPFLFRRCTIKGYVEVKSLDATCGTATFEDCVILNDLGGDGIDSTSAPSLAGKIITSGNLVDVFASTKVDANFLLTGTWSTYNGSKGWAA